MWRYTATHHKPLWCSLELSRRTTAPFLTNSTDFTSSLPYLNLIKQLTAQVFGRQEMHAVTPHTLRTHYSKTNTKVKTTDVPKTCCSFCTIKTKRISQKQPAASTVSYSLDNIWPIFFIAFQYCHITQKPKTQILRQTAHINPLAPKDDFIWCIMWCHENWTSPKTSAKNTQSNRWTFKSHIFWRAYTGHLILPIRIKNSKS